VARDLTTRRTRKGGRSGVALLVLLTLGLLAACGGGDGNGGDAERAPSETRTKAPTTAPGAVTMQLISFDPETVTVDVGGTVTWTQKDPGVHTVTSGNVEQGAGGVTTVPGGRFDSGPLETGRTFTFTFAEPGTYPYFCSVHPATMRGAVQVR
jgi:plastocyanin